MDALVRERAELGSGGTGHANAAKHGTTAHAADGVDDREANAEFACCCFFGMPYVHNEGGVACDVGMAQHSPRERRLERATPPSAGSVVRFERCWRCKDRTSWRH